MLLIRKCEMCGEVFDSYHGQKYCGDLCRLSAIKINKLKYQAKINRSPVKTMDDYKHEMDVLKTATKKTFQKVDVVRAPYTNKYTTENTTNIDYITKSLNALKQLDEAHKQVQDIIDVLKIEQAKYNKEDNEFSHSVEGSGSLTDAQKLQIFNDYQVARSKRRNVKDVIKTLINCVRYIPLNSEQILKDAISNKIKVDDFFKDYYKQRN